jgi:SAM-dependent methyltransferase
VSDVESSVALHYRIDGLLDRILAAVAGLGLATDSLRPMDLERVDEFHIGGVAATGELLDRMNLEAGQSLLDLGSGIGGPARYAARRRGASVTGIDLTPGYVAVATELTRRTGLANEARFVVGSILDLPFADASFDAAMLLHVGMNVPDKPRLMAEAARVLRPGGVFGVYEVMRLMPGAFSFPVPWSSAPETSFVASPEDYRKAAGAAGFTVTAERQRGAFALEFFAQMRTRAAEMAASGGKAPPGLQLIMGGDAPLKIGNLVTALEAGLLAPCEMILKKAA